MKRVADSLTVRAKCSIVALAAFLGASAATFAATSAAPYLGGKLAWRSIGPDIGGRVVAVAGVPGQRDLFYMGAVDGGVWKSADYGVTWHNITDGKLPSASDSIGAIAVAPSNPKVLYAGTGESDIRGDMITGDGVFKSTDAGKTWSYAGLRDTHTISAIIVDPRNPDVVYASSMGHVFKPNTERGVFKSVDGGKTWSRILYVDDKTGAIDLVMDAANPQVLYAAMWQADRTPWSLDDGGPGSGLYKSTDGGAHWTNISRNPGLPRGVLGRIGVGVAANKPSVVYSIVQAKGGGVFRSADGGATWKRVNANWSLRQRGFYYMSIYVDPTDAETVYVPEVDSLWASHDGGKTFVKLHTRHGDNHIVWINPNDPKILLEGNDGGATVSTDGGATWSDEHNQPTGQFYHVALDDQFPFHVYGAQQDEGSFEGPSAMPDGAILPGAWHTVALGESTFVAPKPGDADVTYGSDYYTIMQRYDMTTGDRRSVSPWPEYLDGVSSAELKYRLGWTHPILFSPDDPKELLLGSQYVMKSTDGGRTWARISPDLTRNDPKTEKPSGGPVDLDQTGAEIFPDISALAVSPVDSRVIWAGSQDGLVHVTTDAGVHWQAVTPLLLTKWAEITSIEPSHVAAGTAFLTASRYMWDDFHPYVFMTSDFGRHWVPLTTGLPDDQYAFVVRQDPTDDDLLFLGTKNTVYVSFDAGVHWRSLAFNLPHVQVRDLLINVRQGDVVIATHGRSFWILDNLALLEQLSHESAAPADPTRLYAPETAWLSNAYGQDDHAKYRGPVGTNPPFGATVFFRLPASYDGKVPVSLSFLDAHGQLLRRFALHLKVKKPKVSAAIRDNLMPSEAKRVALEKLTAISPGMNRLQWDLRYADATDVIGFEPPEETDGLVADVRGPLVNPGRYTAVLDFNSRKIRQSFDVALDPRLAATATTLQQRLALELRIHGAVDKLDRNINQAIDVRHELMQAVARRRLAESKAQAALTALHDAIDRVVQLDVRSSEGDVMHEMRLRSFLAYLQADVGLAYVPPNAAQVAAFDRLERQASVGESTLQRAVAQGKRLL
ncbi:MAG TPA: hypothetical protein VMV25_01990 [Steroidobacteraceae bacterium]|nr:hypothetical protein [Steroidobacteraceae bacterium]